MPVLSRWKVLEIIREVIALVMEAAKKGRNSWREARGEKI